MYDAKEKEESIKSVDCTQYDCIYDRSYFQKIQSEHMMNLKSSYVPRENILE